MKKYLAFLFIFSLNVLTYADIDPSSFNSFLTPQVKEPSQIIFNNRPLAKVNGKTISLIDITKKMNLFLHQYAPQAFDSKLSLIQFYLNNWNATLDEMINNELILAEADEKEVKVSDGDVREEMEERFGPNIMTKLHHLGLQYEEARQIVLTELKVRQIIWYKVHAKAMQMVTPAAIKTAYNEYIAANPPIEEWQYSVLSIRGKNQAFCEKLAEKAFSLLELAQEELSHISQKLKETKEIEEANISITLSEDYKADSKSISKEHKEVLTTLAVNAYSKPKLQLSRIDKNAVYRIFYLKNYTKKNPPTFQEMSEKLKDELFNKAIDREKKKYITQLEKKFGFNRLEIKDSLPDNYVPFALD